MESDPGLDVGFASRRHTDFSDRPVGLGHEPLAHLAHLARLVSGS